jgi:hypothetical protein
MTFGDEVRVSGARVNVYVELLGLAPDPVGLRGQGRRKDE